MAEIRGIDISKYQAHLNGKTKINFKELKKQGYDFVIMRASIGKSKDIAFDSHYAAAKAAGMHIGAYHYLKSSTISGTADEANFFLRTIADKQLDYPVCLDIENGAQKKLGKSRCTDVALEFLKKVESTGYYTMLYSYANFIKNYLDMERLRHFDVWLACYTSEERRKQLYKHDILGIWQHTSSGKLPKSVYSGRLDFDIAYKDYAKIIKNTELNRLR